VAGWKGYSGKGLLFVPGTSLLHRANPLTSLIVTVWAISLAAILPLLGTTIFAVAILAFAFAVGVGPTTIKRLAITMVPFGIALFLVHGVLVHAPDSVRVGPLALSRSGVLFAATLFARLAAMLSASLLFVTTTHPSDMLKALDARGVSPVVSYLIASPLLLLEPLSLRAQGIRDAQRARGMDLTGSWRARITALPALLIPLTALALSDLDHRVLVLTGRAFRGNRRRTVLDAPADDVRQMWFRRALALVAVLQLGAPLLWH
jgi:energy-coupling factor transport system permease protein